MKSRFYDDLADAYHLIFQDWGVAIGQQGGVLARLLPPPEIAGRVLDCACGIGTQAIGLAQLGYRVEATDLSEASVRRARHEAAARGLAIEFHVDDMRTVATAPSGSYEVVMAMDNAIPHLDSDDEILAALQSMRKRLRSDGILLLGLRDYGEILAQRPSGTSPIFFRDGNGRRIIHQIWDWLDERRYTVHLYITTETSEGWQSQHFVGHYRAIAPSEIASLAANAGFADVQTLAPEQSGYYQPIVKAFRR